MTFFYTSKIVNASYMFYDTKMIRLDLSDFEGSSIIFIDEALKYNPNLKYINLKNYKGKDIFSDLEDDTEITICTEDEVLEQTSNLLSLKEKNIINICSNYCFRNLVYSKKIKPVVKLIVIKLQMKIILFMIYVMKILILVN